MIDVNLGNKTLIVGVAVALILAYGMVNFNAGSRSQIAFPKVEAVSQTQAPAPTLAPSGGEPGEGTDSLEHQAALPDTSIDSASLAPIQQQQLDEMSASERRQIRHLSHGQ